MRNLNDAWAAGLIEGEGHMMFSPDKRNPDYRYVNIEVGSTDLDVLQGLVSLYGGDIKESRTSKLGKKRFFRWKLYGYEKIYDTLLRIRPWLGERRKSRCDEILGFLLTRNKIKTLYE